MQKPFRSKILLCSTFVFSLVFLPLKAQAAEDQIWTSVQLSTQFKEDFLMLGEFINRYSNETEEFTTRSVRLGVGYQIQPKFVYSLQIENRVTNTDANDEIRFIQQLQQKWDLEKLNLSLRGRLEHREFSDSQVFQNRVRGLVRLDGTSLKFAGITPFFASEYFYITNTVETRPSGSTETRNSLGAQIEAAGGQIEISYVNRTVNTASLGATASKSKDYSVANLVFKWGF